MTVSAESLRATPFGESSPVRWPSGPAVGGGVRGGVRAFPVRPFDPRAHGLRRARGASADRAVP
eukprot:6371634-Alexandrium_andersonii.AAC.1